jgi:hypothetical protein
MVSMVEQLALDFGFASQEGRYSIGGILSWSLPAMSEVPAGDRLPDHGPGEPKSVLEPHQKEWLAWVGRRHKGPPRTCET